MTVKPVLQVGHFILRHLLMVLFCIALGCLLWTLLYVILFVSAARAGEHPGGPFAYPAGIISIAVGGVVIGWGIFAPAAALGRIFCHCLRFPRLAAIPVVFLAAFALSYGLYAVFIQLITTSPMPGFGTVAANYLMWLSLPLAFYWWLTEGPGALWDTFLRYLRRKRDQQPLRSEKFIKNDD